MSDPMEIEFTPVEIAAIDHEVVAMIDRTAHIANYSRRNETRSQAETNRIALKGEYAVAKAFGLPMEACGMLYTGIRMDGGLDLTLPGGVTAQVKTVEVKSNPDHPFWFALESVDPVEFKADVGVMALVLGLRPRVRLSGYVTRDRFVSEHVVVSLGTGRRACMKSSLFDPVTQLRDQILG